MFKIKHEITVKTKYEYEKYVEYSGYSESIRKAAECALNFEKIKFPCEINIEITDNINIQNLNREFRGKDNPTDVLSFPMIEPEKIDILKSLKSQKYKFINFTNEINPENGAVLLGDIIISAEKAKEQSLEIHQSVERELVFLTVHSVLHLLGYDHETSEENDLIMRKKQKEIVDLICINLYNGKNGE